MAYSLKAFRQTLRNDLRKKEGRAWTSLCLLIYGKMKNGFKHHSIIETRTSSSSNHFNPIFLKKIKRLPIWDSLFALS
jgi:hypothetical protein